jgi:ferredoxin
MADQNDRVPENVPGRFFVDTQCIDCGLCLEVAPNNFLHQDEAGYVYVGKQPKNDDEVGVCQEALETCPVEAIGDEGK